MVCSWIRRDRRCITLIKRTGIALRLFHSLQSRDQLLVVRDSLARWHLRCCVVWGRLRRHERIGDGRGTLRVLVHVEQVRLRGHVARADPLLIVTCLQRHLLCSRAYALNRALPSEFFKHGEPIVGEAELSLIIPRVGGGHRCGIVRRIAGDWSLVQGQRLAHI